MLTFWIGAAFAATVGAAALLKRRRRKQRAMRARVKVSDARSLRRTQAGDVVGFADARETHTWLGIPYAAPPVGALRWKAPRPATAWQGTREAIHPSAVSVQFANITIESPPATWNQQVTGHEDCLTLNVHAPRFDANAVPQGTQRLPVMVWIHGGANTVGTANTYRTLRNVAGHDRVVVVSVNYRLGVLGWFNLTELHGAEADLDDRSGNFGTLDLIAALRWVRDNIGAFGGDAGNVTIFGESAGALNVYTLLASPLAKGLFHKAIAQSPLNITATVAEGRNLVDDAVPGVMNSARELVCEWLMRDGRATDREGAKRVLAGMPADELRAFAHSRTPAQLLAPIEPQALGFFASPRLFLDGHVLPSDPLQEVFTDRRRYNAVPLLVGCNRDEYKIFMAQNREHVKMRFGKLPIMKDPGRYQRTASYMSRLWKAQAVNLPAMNMLKSGHTEVWVYRFDWDEQPDVPFIHPPRLVGAAHAVEMPFVFRDTRGEHDPLRINTKANLPGRQHVSNAMADYWAQFAHEGDPAHGRSGRHPAWLRWVADERATRQMVFDTPADGGVRMCTETLDLSNLRLHLANDPNFQDARERCELFARMYIWSEFAPQPRETSTEDFCDGCCKGWTAHDLRPASWP